METRSNHYNITAQCTGIFLPSRDFFQEKQSYVLTESPFSKYEGGGGNNTSPFYFVGIFLTTRLDYILTLTLTSESVYGSQFFHCKLLQVLMS
jgi:hypothetical protein